MGIPPSFPLFQDLDDMDADLLGLKKSHPAASKSAAQGSGKEERPSNPKPASMFTVSAKGEWDGPSDVGRLWPCAACLEGSFPVLWVLSAWERPGTNCVHECLW